MIEEITTIFQEGAAAAVLNVGAGIWGNPYVLALEQAGKAGKSTDEPMRRVSAWDDGWEWQTTHV